MASRQLIDDLKNEQMIDALAFLLHRMPMDTRGKLMAHHPLIYATLYPEVSAEVILDFVRRAIDQQRSTLVPASPAGAQPSISVAVRVGA